MISCLRIIIALSFQTLNSSWHIEIIDHGGLLVAARDNHQDLSMTIRLVVVIKLRDKKQQLGLHPTFIMYVENL